MKKIIILTVFSIYYLNLNSQTTNYFTDNRDGKIYKTIKIGNQEWMAENLQSKFYYDGTPIEIITSNEEWSKSLFGYSYYDFNIEIQKQNGNLYKYFTATDVCPFNWHLPTHADWDKMLFHIGKNVDDFHYAKEKYEQFKVANMLKINDSNLWKTYVSENDRVNESDQIITNKSGFSALPSGFRFTDGTFVKLGKVSFLWATEYESSFFGDGLYIYSLNFFSDFVEKDFGPSVFNFGASVRCVKDEVNSNLTKVHDSLNQFSFSNSSWKPITIKNELLSLNSKQIKNSKNANFIFDSLKNEIPNFDENDIMVSKLSKNKRFFSMNINNYLFENIIFFIDLEKRKVEKLDIARATDWSSYSPNQDYVLFNNNIGGSQNIIIYDIKQNELIDIDFYNQGYSNNEIGFVSQLEYLELDIKNINWITGNEFEVLTQIVSIAEDFKDAEQEDIPNPEIRDNEGKVIYVITYNIESNKVVKTKIAH